MVVMRMNVPIPEPSLLARLKLALPSTATVTTANRTASPIAANRSNVWMASYPTIERAAWQATTTRSPIGKGTASPVTTEIAYAPKNALIASHAMVLSQFRIPGTTIDFPNGRRAAGIWAMPNAGPIAERYATRPAPMTFPMTMARRPVHHPSPTLAASVPTKKAAGTRFGENQTVNNLLTDPYRAVAGIG